jgi:hypothetical protein
MLQNLNLCSVRAESVELSSVNNRLLQTNPPKFKFGCRVRKEVQADPACVNLRSKCPYFYEMGCKLADM